jgi:hypothetical protein
MTWVVISEPTDPRGPWAGRMTIEAFATRDEAIKHFNWLYDPSDPYEDTEWRVTMTEIEVDEISNICTKLRACEEES